jgi:protein transport protein SEC23
LNVENVSNSLIMIQPTLTSFTFDKEPEPVLLDSSSLSENVILLMDTYFHILIYHGKLINDWMKAGYQDQEEFENFRELLEAPKAEAAVYSL